MKSSLFSGKIKWVVLVSLLVSAPALYAQKNNSDTLQLAKKFRAEKKCKQALGLLGTYSANHSKDVNALWLYAQTEFWSGRFKAAKGIYENAIALQPNNDYLQLDYAKALSESGDWNKATATLDKLEAKGKNYTDGEFVKAKIAYWKGDYNSAKKQVDDVLWRDGMNTSAVEFRKELMRAKSPWLQLNAAYTKDDQPLSSILPSVEAGVFLHPYANLHFGFYSPVYIKSGSATTAQWLQAGNQFNFQKAGLLMQVDAGLVKFPSHNQLSWSGNIYLRETVLKHLVIDAQAEHKPYLNTLLSIDTAISVSRFGASVGWNDKKTVNGKIAFDFNYFPDKNFVYAAYGWVYAPAIEFSVVELSLGYSYGFSNSKQNRFTSTEPVAQIIANYSNTTTISGIYNPYFTPMQQHKHSALVLLNIHAVKNIELGASARAGYGYFQNAYLYLNKAADNSTIISTGYYRQAFIPVDASAFISWQLTPKINLQAKYAYHGSYFFSSHTAALNLRISFWNEKKK